MDKEAIASTKQNRKALHFWFQFAEHWKNFGKTVSSNNSVQHNIKPTVCHQRKARISHKNQEEKFARKILHQFLRLEEAAQRNVGVMCHEQQN